MPLTDQITSGMKAARVEKCHVCEQRLSSPSWQWFRCSASGAELDDLYYEGPTSNCPLGYWDALAEVDFEARALQGRLASYPETRRLVREDFVRVLRDLVELDKLGRAWAVMEDLVVAEVPWPLWLWVEAVKRLGELYPSWMPFEAYKIALKKGAGRMLDVLGNDPAYYALRDCVESGACTRGEARDVAWELGIKEPTVV